MPKEPGRSLLALLISHWISMLGVALVTLAGSSWLFQRWHDTGGREGIPAFKVGRAWRFDPERLEIWVKDQQQPQGQQQPRQQATKPPQPIEKSTAGASVLAQVIVAKCADHLPLYRQEKIFERHGVNLSRKTMGGWLAQCVEFFHPLYGSAKQVLFQSKVIGTDDTGVKVLDVKLPFARTGRIWPYYGDKNIR